jgi:predicted nucleic acid-binding protein
VTIFVDSDILIEVARGHNPAIRSIWESLCESDTIIFYSPVSAAELWAGARPNEFDSITELFESLDCIPIEHSIGEQAGAFMRTFGKSHNLKLGDALIAASVVHTKAVLWTRNRKHYPMNEVTFY